MEIFPAIEDILSPGTCIHIEYIDYCGKKVVHQGFVHNMDKSHLRVELPGSAFKHMADIRVNQPKIPIVCKCNNEPRDLVFFTELIKLQQESSTMVVTRPASFVLGRSFQRYEVNLPFNFFYDGVEYVDCTIINLSFGGLSGIVNTNSMLKPGLEIVCQITLPGSSPEYIVGHIIRLEEQGIHCKVSVKFEDVTADIEGKIAKFFNSIANYTGS